MSSETSGSDSGFELKEEVIKQDKKDGLENIKNLLECQNKIANRVLTKKAFEQLEFGKDVGNQINILFQKYPYIGIYINRVLFNKVITKKEYLKHIRCLLEYLESSKEQNNSESQNDYIIGVLSPLLVILLFLYKQRNKEEYIEHVTPIKQKLMLFLQEINKAMISKCGFTLKVLFQYGDIPLFRDRLIFYVNGIPTVDGIPKVTNNSLFFFVHYLGLTCDKDIQYIFDKVGLNESKEYLVYTVEIQEEKDIQANETKDKTCISLSIFIKSPNTNERKCIMFLEMLLKLKNTLTKTINTSDSLRICKKTELKLEYINWVFRVCHKYQLTKKSIKNILDPNSENKDNEDRILYSYWSVIIYAGRRGWNKAIEFCINNGLVKLDNIDISTLLRDCLKNLNPQIYKVLQDCGFNKCFDIDTISRIINEFIISSTIFSCKSYNGISPMRKDRFRRESGLFTKNSQDRESYGINNSKRNLYKECIDIICDLIQRYIEYKRDSIDHKSLDQLDQLKKDIDMIYSEIMEIKPTICICKEKFVLCKNKYYEQKLVERMKYDIISRSGLF